MFLGAFQVCISDNFKLKFTRVRFFCTWVMTISKYHFCQNRRCKWQIQTWKGHNIKNRRSELKILSRSIISMYKRWLWAKIYLRAIFLYISNDYFEISLWPKSAVQMTNPNLKMSIYKKQAVRTQNTFTEHHKYV